MADTNTKIKNNEMSADVAAFQADVELEKYRQRVETGALTKEEKDDRKQVLDFLGFSE
jgi:hypothetical protein